MTGFPRFRRTLPGLLGLFAFLLAGCADSPTAPSDAAALSRAATAPHQPVLLVFDKTLSHDWVWDGAVTGDIQGSLQTVLTDLRVSGPIWHVRFDWIINAGGQSFTADLSGILNTNTGKVVMNGRVVDGYLRGAQVHEEGQLIDPATLRFQGTIRIMPATAR